MEEYRINRKTFLFDLDGTLLRSDKSISDYTSCTLRKCKEKGILIGIATARSERNSEKYISEINPDIVISSGGALIKYKNEYIFRNEFSSQEVKEIIKTARRLCGNIEITADTVNAHYWNRIFDSQNTDPNWGESLYTDFSVFSENALKICFEIFDCEAIKQLSKIFNNCKITKFSDSEWYMLTPKSVSKENAVLELCKKSGIELTDIFAFGDDYSDIGMLKLCGKGIAVGNSISEVKDAADLVIGCNDDDGIAKYIERFINKNAL